MALATDDTLVPKQTHRYPVSAIASLAKGARTSPVVHAMAFGTSVSALLLALVYDGRQLKYTYLALGIVVIAWAFTSRARPQRAPANRVIAGMALAALWIPVLRFIVDGIPTDDRYRAVLGSIIGYPAFWFAGILLSRGDTQLVQRMRRSILILPMVGAVLSLAAFMVGVTPRVAYWIVSQTLTIQLSNGWHRFAITADNVWLFAFAFVMSVVIIGSAETSKKGRILAALVGIASGALLLIEAEFALIGGAVVGLVITRQARRRGERRRLGSNAAVVAILIAFGVLVIALWSTDSNVVEPIRISLQNKNTAAGNSVLDGRQQIWSGALSHIVDSPFFGYGISYWGETGDDFSFGNPHNVILSTSLQFGIPAMLVIGAFVISVGLTAVRLGRTATTIRTRQCAEIATAAWTVLWIPSLVSGRMESAFFSGFGLCAIASTFLTLGLRYSQSDEAVAPTASRLASEFAVLQHEGDPRRLARRTAS